MIGLFRSDAFGLLLFSFIVGLSTLQGVLMVRFLLRQVFLAFPCFMLFSLPAFAHPHVWVQVQSELVLSGDQVTAVRHNWAFDEAFSAFATQGLDENGDGVLSREELQPLAQVNVESLSEFGYFSDIYREGAPDVEESVFAEPRDYWLSWKGPQLVLHFTLPLKEPVDAKGAKVLLDVYDPTFFVDFSFAEDTPAKLDNARAGCSVATKVPDAGAFDDTTLGMLAQIPADQRDIPDDLMQVTSSWANQVILTCK